MEWTSHRSSFRSTIRMLLACIMAVLAIAVLTGTLAAETGPFAGDSRDPRTVDETPLTGEIPAIYDESRGVSRVLDTSDDQQRDHDAEQASFQAVFFPDERVRVTNTTEYPNSAIAQIEKYAGGQHAGSCTGTFVGPNAVITAGHCLYTSDTGWGDGIAVIPGRDGEAEPFGYEWASDAWVPSEWFNTEDPFWDWGILRIPGATMGNTVGWLQIGSLSTSTLAAPEFQPVITGFPADKWPYGSMWTGTESEFISVAVNHLFYTIDTAAGQSGAAILRASDNAVVGIHMGAISEANVGTRINAGLLDDIVAGCATIDCELSYFIEGGPSSPIPSPPPPEPPPPPTLPGQPGNVELIESEHFEHTWRRTDGPTTDGHVSRTWMWGPAPFTPSIVETYLESPGGEREVQYFDKTRMERTHPDGDPDSIWYVTNGLLAKELISGRRQLGDNTFEQYSPAEINVAGDGNDPDGPTYASFSEVIDAGPLPPGSTITQVIDRNGNIANDPALAAHSVVAAYSVPETGHTVASPFWQFINSTGPVYEDENLVQGALFQNPFYATGFPLTEAYWATVRIDGQPQTVLTQVFERRVLTYAPGNPPGWQVEAGNVGIHYFTWRYITEPDSSNQ